MKKGRTQQERAEIAFIQSVIRDMPEFRALEQRVADLENESDTKAIDELDDERELERLHQLDEDMAAYEEAGWGDDW